MDVSSTDFNFSSFTIALSRMCSIGISAAHLNNAEFHELRQNLFDELAKYSKEASQVFQAVLSDSFLQSMSHDMIRPFNDGFLNYTNNFLNVNQLHRQTILSNMKLGKQNFVELIKMMKSAQEAKLLACIPLYLDKITQQYMLSAQEE